MRPDCVPGQPFDALVGCGDRRGRLCVRCSCSPLILILLATLIALVPLAHATQPDPVWIEGVYDDADYDDVIGSATSLESPVQADPVPAVVAMLNAIGSVPPLDAGIPHAGALQTPPTRAPPFPDPWTPTDQACLGGFKMIIDLAFDEEGNLYVLQYTSGPLQTGLGVLIRVTPDESEPGGICAQYRAGTRTTGSRGTD